VGMLWGDGIDYEGIRNILFALCNAKWASNNIVFGMGGGLLQKINRDTQRFAFKSCAQKRDGVWHDVFKQPLDSSKKSNKGRLKLIFDAATNKYSTIAENEFPVVKDELQLVFLNGKIVKEIHFAEVRKNAQLV